MRDENNWYIGIYSHLLRIDILQNNSEYYDFKKSLVLQMHRAIVFIAVGY